MTTGAVTEAALGLPAGADPKQVCPLTTSQLVAKILEFTKAVTGSALYTYQYVFAARVIESILLNDAAEITGLWSRQSGKCLARGTPVLRYDGTIVPVETIREGDLLMGDDSTPRRVLSLARGRERMVRVVPRSGCHEPYVVNRSHILSVQRKHLGSSAQRPRTATWVTEDVPVESLLGRPVGETICGYKVPVAFPPTDVLVDPYWLGLWLGDGSERAPQITTADPEIVDAIRDYASVLGMRMSRYEEAPRNAASTYAIVGKLGTTDRSRLNPLTAALRSLGVIENKHVPQAYRANTEYVRRALLAGLVDSNGHRPTGAGKENVCELVFVNRTLANDTQWLARSLGFRASLTEKVVQGTSYWRVCLYGELWTLPTRVARKQYPVGELRQDPRHYGFDLEELPEDDYFGFVIDGNRRFLLGDCTVTHNTESVAQIGLGLCMLLPALANAFPDDIRLRPFRKGFRVGIFAPIDDQAKFPFARIRQYAESPRAQEIMADQEINLVLTVSRGDTVAFSNGSFVRSRSASEDSQIEGGTFELVILEEAQKLSISKVEKEISPMLASTNGTMVKIGTAGMSRGGFHVSIQKNVDHHRATGVRNHFEFPYDKVIAEKTAHYKREAEAHAKDPANNPPPDPFHLRYEKYVAKEIKKIGGTDTIEFRMNYMCIWQESRVIAVPPEVLARAAMEHSEVEITRNGFQVAGLDVGKTTDASVLTMLDIDMSHPIVNRVTGEDADPDKQVYYMKRVLDWLELDGPFEGDDGQYQRIVEYLRWTSVRVLVVDATGKGDAVCERLDAMLGDSIVVVPFVYSVHSKSNGFRYYLQEMRSGRFKFPAGPQTRQSRPYKRFVEQHEELDRAPTGNHVMIFAPEGKHDDYPNSAMLACYAEKVSADVMMPEMEITYLGKDGGVSSGGPQRGTHRYARRW